MRRSTLSAQRLVAVFLAGVVLLNYPLLSLFDQPTSWLAIPGLYVYLFVVWTGLIAVMAWISGRDD